MSYNDWSTHLGELYKILALQEQSCQSAEAGSYGSVSRRARDPKQLHISRLWLACSIILSPIFLQIIASCIINVSIWGNNFVLNQADVSVPL